MMFAKGCLTKIHSHIGFPELHLVSYGSILPEVSVGQIVRARGPQGWVNVQVSHNQIPGR